MDANGSRSVMSGSPRDVSHLEIVLSAHVETLGQFALRQVPAFAQIPDGIARHIVCHTITPCPKAYHAKGRKSTYAS